MAEVPAIRLRKASQYESYFRHAACLLCLAVAMSVALPALLSSHTPEPAVLMYIPGIDDETRAHIDSGEWSDEAVRLDQSKGLLPPGVTEDSNGSHFPSSTEDHAAKKKTKRKEPATTPSPSAPSSPKSNESSAEASNQSAAGNASVNRGTPATSPSVASGHCQRDTHITCTADSECGPLGDCVYWHCSDNAAISCATSDDCGTGAGICTGPGYCANNRETACAKNEDCDVYGGDCELGGTCTHSKSPCLENSDCRHAGDACSFQKQAWWRANTDFPTGNDGFGPYPNWTEPQLRKKLLLTMKKIMHMQADLQFQVPVNTHLEDMIRNARLKRRLVVRRYLGQIKSSLRHENDMVDSTALHAWDFLLGPSLKRNIASLNDTLIRSDSEQDQQIALIGRDIQSFNESFDSAIPQLDSSLGNLSSEINETVARLKLNSSHQYSSQGILDNLNASLAAAERELGKDLDDFSRDPVLLYREDEREVANLFADLQSTREEHLSTIRQDIKDLMQKIEGQPAETSNISKIIRNHNPSTDVPLDELSRLLRNITRQSRDVELLEEDLNRTLVIEP